VVAVFELDRRQVAQRGVAPARVVEALDVLEDRVGQLGAGVPAAPVEQLGLQGREERLGDGVVEGLYG